MRKGGQFALPYGNPLLLGHARRRLEGARQVTAE